LDVALIVLACAVLGALAQTLVRFLSKIIQSSSPVSFDVKYWATMALSIILTLIAALGVFMVFPIPEGLPLVYIAVSALLSGFASNVVVNLTVDTVVKQ
jgi:hypothetical protein